MIDTRVRDRCWAVIGIFGNGSCPELKTWIHCRNCPVSARAGRQLLEQFLPDGYAETWTEVLAEAKDEEVGETTPVVVFRLGVEWFAIKVGVFQEVATRRPYHQVPHVTNRVFKGLANIQGELLPLVSLWQILQMDQAEPERTATGQLAYERLLVLSDEGDRWVIPADEIWGVYRLPHSHLQEAPATIARAADSYSKGLFDLGGRRVGYLDEELVFNTLKRSLR